MAGPEQHAELEAHMQAEGYRMTLPRRTVWSVLSGATDHLTADEIAEQARQAEPGINLASVYRSLALFKDLDLVRESNLGDDASRWEVAHPDEHFHLVCDSCGKIDHHIGTLVKEIRDHLSGGHGFQPGRVELTVHGTCSACS